MLVLAWLVSAVVLGVAFLSCAGACVVVVQGAALRRPPFAALAGWLCCLAGLAARSCSRCLTGGSLGLVAAAVLEVWPVASCGGAACTTTKAASAAVCRLEKPLVAEDHLPCVCSGGVVVERCWRSRSALIALAVLVLLVLLRVVARRTPCVGAAVGFARCCLVVRRLAGSLASCQVEARRCLDRWLLVGFRLMSCPWLPCCHAVAVLLGCPAVDRAAPLVGAGHGGFGPPLPASPLPEECALAAAASLLGPARPCCAGPRCAR